MSGPSGRGGGQGVEGGGDADGRGGREGCGPLVLASGADGVGCDGDAGGDGGGTNGGGSIGAVSVQSWHARQEPKVHRVDSSAGWVAHHDWHRGSGGAIGGDDGNGELGNVGDGTNGGGTNGGGSIGAVSVQSWHARQEPKVHRFDSSAGWVAHHD